MSKLNIQSSRMDADTTAFFGRQLETVRAGLFEVLFPELKGMNFVPVNTSVNPGAEIFTYRWFEETGTAEFTSGYGQRGPRADIAGHEASSPIRAIVDSYGYSFQEVRAAMMAGLPLQAAKANAARKAIAQKMDDIMLLGDGTLAYGGLTGLFKLSGTCTATTAGTWGSLLPDAIIAEMNELVDTISTTSKGIHEANTLLLPLSTYRYLSSTRMGDGSDATILSFFKANHPGVAVDWSVKLETAGTGGAKRAMAYVKSPDMLEAIVPVAFEQFAPQEVGFEQVTDCHARMGGVVCYYPKSVCYMDSI